MIAFDLNCGNGHQFEGWFTSSVDFETQKSIGQLACPLCGDMHVQKALSVPNVSRKGNQRPVKETAGLREVTAPISQPLPAQPLAPAMVELVQKLAQAQSEMLDKSQWVGGNFAETARAIHYGEESDRMIHGETSTDEAKALLEEGITVAPLLFPVVPPLAKN